MAGCWRAATPSYATVNTACKSPRSSSFTTVLANSHTSVGAASHAANDANIRAASRAVYHTTNFTTDYDQQHYLSVDDLAADEPAVRQRSAWNQPRSE